MNQLLDLLRDILDNISYWWYGITHPNIVPCEYPESNTSDNEPDIDL